MTRSDHPRQLLASKELKSSKNSDIVLPSLPLRVEQLRSEAKAKYLSKKYKIFKLIH